MTVEVETSRRTERPARFSMHTIAESQKTLGVVGLILGAIIWQTVATLIDNPLVLPTFQAAASQLIALAVEAEMRLHLLETLARVIIGFSAGSLLGLAIGATIGASESGRVIINPYLNFLRAIAPIAWIVPATVWLGIGNPPILFVVVYSAVFPVALNTMSGIAAVHPDRIRMARSFGLGSFGVFRQILIPSAVPYVFAGMRLGLGLAFMAVIGAEMIIGRSGLGYIIYDARTTFDTDVMFAGILALGIIGYLGDLVFVSLRRKFFNRYYEGRAEA
jgi:NitT/TauT family transport system permease protein